MRKSIKLIIAMVFAVFIAFTAFTFIKPAEVAANSGVSGAPTGQALLSATNTYNIDYFSTQPLNRGQGDVYLDRE